MLERVEWWPWAYFVLKQGDTLGDRIEQFERLGREENPGGQYVPVEGRHRSTRSTRSGGSTPRST